MSIKHGFLHLLAEISSFTGGATAIEKEMSWKLGRGSNVSQAIRRDFAQKAIVVHREKKEEDDDKGPRETKGCRG